MNEEQSVEVVQVVDAEMVAPPATRDPLGKFAPGTTVSRKGSANRLTKAIKERAIQEIEAGGTASNPLLVIRDIMLTSEDELTRLAAADKLAKFLFGVNVKQQFEVEVSDGADEERVARTRKIFAALFVSEETA